MDHMNKLDCVMLAMSCESVKDAHRIANLIQGHPSEQEIFAEIFLTRLRREDNYNFKLITLLFSLSDKNFSLLFAKNGYFSIVLQYLKEEINQPSRSSKTSTFAIPNPKKGGRSVSTMKSRTHKPLGGGRAGRRAHSVMRPSLKPYRTALPKITFSAKNWAPPPPKPRTSPAAPKTLVPYLPQNSHSDRQLRLERRLVTVGRFRLMYKNSGPSVRSFKSTLAPISGVAAARPPPRKAHRTYKPVSRPQNKIFPNIRRNEKLLLQGISIPQAAAASRAPPAGQGPRRARAHGKKRRKARARSLPKGRLPSDVSVAPRRASFVKTALTPPESPTNFPDMKTPEPPESTLARIASAPSGSPIPRLQLQKLPSLRDNRSVHRALGASSLGAFTPTNVESLSSINENFASDTFTLTPSNLQSHRATALTSSSDLQATFSKPTFFEQRAAAEGIGEIREMGGKFGEYMVMRYLPHIVRLKVFFEDRKFKAVQEQPREVYSLADAQEEINSSLALPFLLFSEWSGFSAFSEETLNTIFETHLKEISEAMDAAAFKRTLLAFILWRCIEIVPYKLIETLENPALVMFSLLKCVFEAPSAKAGASASPFSAFEALSYISVLSAYTDTFENHTFLEWNRLHRIGPFSLCHISTGPVDELPPEKREKYMDEVKGEMKTAREKLEYLDCLRRNTGQFFSHLSLRLKCSILQATKLHTSTNASTAFAILGNMLLNLRSMSSKHAAFELCSDVLFRACYYMFTARDEGVIKDPEFIHFNHRVLVCINAFVSDAAALSPMIFSKKFQYSTYLQSLKNVDKFVDTSLNPKTSSAGKASGDSDTAILSRLRVFFRPKSTDNDLITNSVQQAILEMLMKSPDTLAWLKNSFHSLFLDEMMATRFEAAGYPSGMLSSLFDSFRTEALRHIIIFAILFSKFDKTAIVAPFSFNEGNFTRNPIQSARESARGAQFKTPETTVWKNFSSTRFAESLPSGNFQMHKIIEHQEHPAGFLAQKSQSFSHFSQNDLIEEVKLGMDNHIVRGPIETLRSTAQHPLLKLAFLIEPSFGLLHEFLKRNEGKAGTVVGAMILECLAHILSIPGNPFIAMTNYCDHFISYHYFEFLKLYFSEKEALLLEQSPSSPRNLQKRPSTPLPRVLEAEMPELPEPTVSGSSAATNQTVAPQFRDPTSLEIASYHLKVLLCFAKHRCEYARRKFYLLGTVLFMGSEFENEMKISMDIAERTHSKQAADAFMSLKAVPALERVAHSSSRLPESILSTRTSRKLLRSTSETQLRTSADSVSPRSGVSDGLSLGFRQLTKPPSWITENLTTSPMGDAGATLLHSSLKGGELNPTLLKLPTLGSSSSKEHVPGVEHNTPSAADSAEASEISYSYSLDDSLDGWEETAKRFNLAQDASADEDPDSDSDYELLGDSKKLVPGMMFQSLKSTPLFKAESTKRSAVPPLGGGPSLPAAPGPPVKLNLNRVPQKGEESSTKSEAPKPVLPLSLPQFSPNAKQLDVIEERGLSKLEAAVNKEGVGRARFHLFLGAHPRSSTYLGANTQPAEHDAAHAPSAEAAEGQSSRESFVDAPHLDETQNSLLSQSNFSSPLYNCHELHISMLKLVLCLLIRPPLHFLDPLYTSQLPANQNFPNILFILRHHLNHPRNQDIIPDLFSRVKAMGPGAVRLMRLLCKMAFEPSTYPLQYFKLIGTGAYGKIYAGDVSVPLKNVFSRPGDLERISKSVSERIYGDSITASPKKVAVGPEGEVFTHHRFPDNYILPESGRQVELSNKLFLQPVAVKVLPISLTPYDRSVIHDIFSEISILERFGNSSNICQVYDYGLTNDSYYIVMRRYTCSLKGWREKISKAFNGRLGLAGRSLAERIVLPCAPGLTPMVTTGNELSMICYTPILLKIYRQVATAVLFMHLHGVNHHDMKCDNALLSPIQNPKEWFSSMEDFERELQKAALDDRRGDITKGVDIFDPWTWPIGAIPVQVAMGDFGESTMFAVEDESYTEDNRGTEYIKSPEMLMVANASRKMKAGYDRRKPQGASSPSDVWGCGCLLFELLTGDFLFYDPDWIRFFIRVVTRGQKLISPEKEAMVGNCQPVLLFLEKILIREQEWRPKVQDLLRMLDTLILRYFGYDTELKTREYFEGVISRAACDPRHVEQMGFDPPVFPELTNEEKNQYTTRMFGVRLLKDSPSETPRCGWGVTNWNFGIDARGQPLSPNPAELIAPVEPRSDHKPFDNGGTSTTTRASSLFNLSHNSIIKRYFKARVVKVLPFLSTGSLGSVDLTLDKRVTHIIVCADKKPAHKIAQEVMFLPPSIARLCGLKRGKSFVPQILRRSALALNKAFPQFADNEVMAAIQASPPIFREFSHDLACVLDFIRRSVVGAGHCHLVDNSGNSLAVAVAIAFVLENQYQNFMNALVAIRLMFFRVSIPPLFLRFLSFWDLMREKRGVQMNTGDFGTLPSTRFTHVATPRFQCVCGKVFFVLRPHLHSSEIEEMKCPNQFQRHFKAHSEAGGMLCCPVRRCVLIRDFLNNKFLFSERSVAWKIVERVHFVSNFRDEAETFTFRSHDDTDNMRDEEGTMFHRCTLCGTPMLVEFRGVSKVYILGNFPF